MAGIEDGEVGFEEGMSWLTSHVLDVLDEAISPTWDAKEYVRRQEHHQYRNFSRSPVESRPQYMFYQSSKSSPKPHCRAKYYTNSVSGGPGMQAIFLESGRKSCGTGVFLPQRAGNKLQSIRKPACSVLLPARVIQALNLNVHELLLQRPRHQDAKNSSKGGDCNSVKNKNGMGVTAQCCFESQNENSSPEMFLPEEWTY